MDPAATLERLMTAGVFDAAGESNELEFSGAFLESIERHRTLVTDWDEQTLLDEVTIVVGGEDVTHRLADALASEPDGVAEYLALSEFVTDATERERLRMLAAVDRFLHPDRPTGGVPDAFLPVHCSLYGLLADVSPCAIAYFWRENCEPCDLVRHDFDELFDRAPENMSLYAVYGPDCSADVLDEYQLGGAPTVLFVLDGDVDARLVGAHFPDILESEVEILQERGTTRTTDSDA